uniref:Uncharacterized protein n=1 Tax=Kalanchoe fedtschenkoi TaxID=63787 RepID=A0A7N0UFP6_KALFE
MEGLPRKSNKSPAGIAWPSSGLMIQQRGVLTVATRPGERLIPPACAPASYALSSPKWGKKKKKDTTEAKRKKRMALYNSYAVQGRMKATVTTGFSWMKRKYEFLVHGC